MQFGLVSRHPEAGIDTAMLSRSGLMIPVGMTMLYRAYPYEQPTSGR
jgi:hypothetical protein